MIKCFGFGKLLKQLSIISLISCFGLGLGSFVSSAYYIPGADYDLPLNFGTNDSDFILSKNLTFGNEFNNNYVGKIITTNSSNNNFQYYFFRVNNKIYYIGFYQSNGIRYQGYINKLCVKEGTVNTCNSENLESFYNGDFGNSFDIVNLTFSNNRRDFKMCFDNDTTDEIIYCINDDSGNNLIDSEGYTFTTMEDIFNNAPATVSKFGNGNGGDSGSSGGSSDGYIDNNLTGDYIYTTCTNGFALNKLESYGMNKYMCYGGLTGYTNLDLTINYNIVAGEGETVFNIYNQTRESGQSFEDWFTYWNTTYTHQYVSNQNLFLNNPAVLRSYFYLYNQYGDGFTNVDIKEYCRLLLTTNTGDTYNGNMQFLCRGYNNGVSQNELGYNVESVNWSGVGNIGSGSSSGNSVKVSNNPVVFIQNFFNELKASLPTRYDLGGGFLPVYIITFLCAIILFRFLSH